MGGSDRPGDGVKRRVLDPQLLRQRGAADDGVPAAGGAAVARDARVAEGQVPDLQGRAESAHERMPADGESAADAGAYQQMQGGAVAACWAASSLGQGREGAVVRDQKHRVWRPDGCQVNLLPRQPRPLCHDGAPDGCGDGQGRCAQAIAVGFMAPDEGAGQGLDDAGWVGVLVVLFDAFEGDTVEARDADPPALCRDLQAATTGPRG